MFPPNLTWTGARPGSGGSADPMYRLSHHLSSWTLPGGPPSCVFVCPGFIRRFDLSNGPFLYVTQDAIFCAIVLRLVFVFSLFHLWVPANQDSLKLMELVRIKPYN